LGFEENEIKKRKVVGAKAPERKIIRQKPIDTSVRDAWKKQKNKTDRKKEKKTWVQS